MSDPLDVLANTIVFVFGVVTGCLLWGRYKRKIVPKRFQPRWWDEQ